jgi:hypothetical protein
MSSCTRLALGALHAVAGSAQQQHLAPDAFKQRQARMPSCWHAAVTGYQHAACSICGCPFQLQTSGHVAGLRRASLQTHHSTSLGALIMSNPRPLNACKTGCAQADFKAEYGDLPAKSEEELNAQLGELQHRITHESVTLNEEKAALARIKKLEAAREKVGS